MPLGRRLAVPIALALLLVSIIPIGAGIASASTSRWAANCDLNVRTRPTTSATLRARIPNGTVVTVSGKVSGGWYATRCRTAVSGQTWLAITAIGGRSVKSLYGVSTLYAASRLFRSTPNGPVEGIDVSQWQGWIDFGRVRASGREFALIRATAGRLTTDSRYARNRAAAMAAGLAVGAYHFAHPDTKIGSVKLDATREADHFLAVAGYRHGMLLPVLDLETGSRLGTTRLQTWVKTWLARVYSKLHVKAVIYTTASFWDSYMGDTRWFTDNGYRVLWIAHWGTTSPAIPASNWAGRSWTMWQYSDCGKVPGIRGCVDLDRFRGADLASITY
jgi:GH25 family lysozyme M1 (1,4-beta-N-acetylmuramidase)